MSIKLTCYGLQSMAPSLPATELGVSPSTSTPASPRPVSAKPLEYFRECWGADTKVSADTKHVYIPNAYHSISSMCGRVNFGIVC